MQIVSSLLLCVEYFSAFTCSDRVHSLGFTALTH